MSSHLTTVTTTVCLLSCMVVFGYADTAQPDLDFFEKKIRPVLVEHCYRCHSEAAKKVRGGFRLDTRAATHKGGESGPGVVPGNPEESLLLSALRYDAFEMPPNGKLDDQVIADFEFWIRGGAADPRAGELAETPKLGIDMQAGRDFWSFRPIRPSVVPQVADTAWCETDIDRFILADLESKQITPVAQADRVTLIRRASYALAGLPPTTQQIDAFAGDPSPDPKAYGDLVDRLLESKHFGERWGRRWLDVVRFAESSGGGRTLMFPNAWRYRDYVVESLNRDLPFDQFLQEQLAGDLMQASDWQARARQIIATSFLVLGPTNFELQDKEILEMDIVDEQLDTMGKAFLGMTIGCARCHDHKFDPIPTRDYYAMAGIFKSTKSVIHSNVSAWNTTPLPVAPELDAALRNKEAAVAELSKELKNLKQQLAKLTKGKQHTSRAIDPRSLVGTVIDDTAGVKQGKWVASTSVAGYVGAGYLHDDHGAEQLATLTYSPQLKSAGQYEVRVSYTPGGNRSKKVPVLVQHSGGTTVLHLDQTQPANLTNTLHSLGSFAFDPAKQPHVIITNDGAAQGVVIADAVIFVREQDVELPAIAKAKAATNSQATDNSQLDDNKRARDEAVAKKLASQIKKLEAQVKRRKSEGPRRPVAMAVVDKDKIGDVHLAIRGVAHNQGEVVPRGMMQVVETSETSGPHFSSAQSGRLEMAQWITDPQNPLTARVMVNRIWYWLFGEGLVRTVDNFGAMGEMPSHPELLDYLATQFVRDGWSIKRLVRQIMISRVYQLQSDQFGSPNGNKLDPSNRLLWRMNRRRLDAESLRDTLLFVSGSLDDASGGSNIKPGTKIEYDYEFDSTRRSVYLPVFRNTLPEIFQTFDFADPNIQGGKRTTSTIAPQALLLMNHPFVIHQAKLAATQLLNHDSHQAIDQIQQAYREVLGRGPSVGEAKLSQEFVGDSHDPAVWGMLYQTLFQSLDFRYVN